MRRLLCKNAYAIEYTENKHAGVYITYLLTPWCRVLLEKLTGLQLVKKFPAFHGTRMFITALTSARQLYISWASPIQSIYPHPTSWSSILILSTHLRLGLPSGLFPSGFPTKTLYTPSPHPYAPRAQPISFFSILSPAQYWVRSKSHLAPRYAEVYITYNKSQQVALISQIYFDKELYMFRTDLLSIIRSLNTVYTAMVICYDCLLARST